MWSEHEHTQSSINRLYWIFILISIFLHSSFYSPPLHSMTRHNNYDSSSYLPIHTASYNLASFAYAQRHLIRDGFMCSRPPVGAEIVLFLSESPLIFYYAIKSICCSHKQLEIKWAPLMDVCTCMCVCVLCLSHQPAKSQDKAIPLTQQNWGCSIPPHSDGCLS